MAISYTATAIVVSDDKGVRAPIILPRNATQSQVDAAAAQYHPQPIEADVLGFFAELGRDPLVGDLLAQMMQPRPNPAHAPQAALGLGVGLGQVADNGDPRVFLDAWRMASERGLLTAELIAKVRRLATAHNLPADFVGALAP